MGIFKFLFFLILSLFLKIELSAQSTTIDTLRFATPSHLNIDSLRLYNGVDSIITQALDSGAFPGCQILMAKEGKIFYYHSFGYHTYDSIQKVKNSDLYDLASITKITATTLALMKLQEEGKFDLDQTLGYYFPFLAKSNKSELTMRKVLAHQSKLKNWIPYYSESQRKNGKYRRKTISTDSSANYPNRVPGSDLFLHKDFKEDKIYKMIKKSDLYEEEKYVYSGLAFYLFPELIRRLSGVSFDQYLNDHFYSPLGAKSMGFEPLRKYSSSEIVPTEVDTFFRMKKLHGTVHDEGAAVMLGISGNAGLFSNAYDLAKVYQMLLNGGTYNGRTYLNPETIAEFTRCQYCEKGNRRGLGFDKPLIEYDSIKTSVAKLTSPNSYGHSGYTGTLIWVDPDNHFLFIFLANRVFPTRINRKIYTLNIRPRIHDMVYGLLENKNE